MSYDSLVFKTDSTYTKYNFELHRTTGCKKVSRGGRATSSAHTTGTVPHHKQALGHVRRVRTYCHVKSPCRTDTFPTSVEHPSPAQSSNTFW